jgi:modulator of FtsH protease HflC
MGKKHLFTIFVGFVIVVALLLQMFTFQVRTTEIAIRHTFGKPATEAEAPGFHWRAPWPIQSIRTFDNRTHVFEGKSSELQTKEAYMMLCTPFVGFKIGNIARFNEHFGNAGETAIKKAWSNVEKTVRGKLNATIGRHSLQDLVSKDKAGLKYIDIENEVRDAVSDLTLEQFGIQIMFVKIKRLELYDAAKVAVYQSMKAERVAAAKSIEEDGLVAAEEIKSTARADAKIMENTARALAAKTLSDAKRVEAAHLRVIADAKNGKALKAYQVSKMLDAIEKIADQNLTVFLTGDMTPFNVFKDWKAGSSVNKAADKK